MTFRYIVSGMIKSLGLAIALHLVRNFGSIIDLKGKQSRGTKGEGLVQERPRSEKKGKLPCAAVWVINHSDFSYSLAYRERGRSVRSRDDS